MPIWLRKVTYGHLTNFKQLEKTAKTGVAANSNLDNMSSEQVKQLLKQKAESVADNPDYITKARK